MGTIQEYFEWWKLPTLLFTGWIISIYLIFDFVTGVVPALLQGTTGYQRVDLITSISGVIINSILTLGVLYLYKKIADTESHQKDLMRIQRLPTLLVESYEPISPTDFINRDGIQLTLTNAGSGVATDLRLHSELEFEDPLYRGCEKESSLYTESSGTSLKNFVLPTEEGVEFQGQVRAKVKSKDGNLIEGPISRVIKTIAEQGVDTIHLRLAVVSDTVVEGEDEQNLFFDYEIDIDGEMRFAELDQQGRPFEISDEVEL